MRRKKRTGILTFLVFLIFVFSMVVWASDGIEGERMDTEDTETERVIRESEDRESQIQEESEGIAGETFTENDVETERGIEDYYVYDKLGLPEEKQSVDCEIESSERILSDKNEKLKELKSRIDKLPRYYRSQLRKVLKWKDGVEVV